MKCGAVSTFVYFTCDCGAGRRRNSAPSAFSARQRVCSTMRDSGVGSDDQTAAARHCSAAKSLLFVSLDDDGRLCFSDEPSGGR